VGIDIFESIASFLSKKIKKCLARSLSVDMIASSSDLP
jgi:hypothetical protein